MNPYIAVAALSTATLVSLASIIVVCSTIQARIESDAKVQQARYEADTAKEQASKAMWEHIQREPTK